MKLSKEEFIQKTFEMAKNMDICLNQKQLEKLYVYKEMLLEWNEKINLTAIVDDYEIIAKHIIDSLESVKYIKEGKNLIDVGTGAGLPGIIIAIYFEGKVNITLFDALNKRIMFLNEVIKKLKLKKTIAVHGRAEEACRDSSFRERFDIVISRAVAVLNVLLEITTPFVKVGGECIYMKSDKVNEELPLSNKAANQLNVRLEAIDDYKIVLGNEEIKHNFVIYRKEKNTTDKYPRHFSKIKKNPL